MFKNYVKHGREYTGLIVGGLVALVGVVMAGVGGYHFFHHVITSSFSASLPTGQDIRFVTPTPVGGMHLTEGQRSQGQSPVAPPVSPLSTPRPYYAGAHEMGAVLVLEYHRIAYPETRWQRTPDNFRADLMRLYYEGYYPTNFNEMLAGFPDVPPGKKPVVLTFDDSDITQFRVLDNNTLDSDSALGILLDMNARYKDEWPTRATFFVLGNDANSHFKIFGQPTWVRAKLEMLVNLGMEIGSHTVTHTDLSAATAERIYWELAISKHVIEALVPGYTVETMSVPFGGFPYTLDFFKSGQWETYSYTYKGNVAAWGGPGPSPHAPEFEPYKVPRLEVNSEFFDHWLTHFADPVNPYYISDGDPTRLTYPQEAALINETVQQD